MSESDERAERQARREAQREGGERVREHIQGIGLSGRIGGGRRPPPFGRGAGGNGRGSGGGGGEGGGSGDWADLVGKKAEKAARKIRKENPGLNVVVVPEGSMVTMDMRMDRVRVWVDSEDRVTRVPRVG